MSDQPSEFFAGKSLELGQAIAAGDHAQVEQLCQHEAIELNAVHDKDMTFGHFALLHKDAQSLGILTKHGASPHINIPGVGSVYFCAIKAAETKYLAALLDNGVDPNSKDEHEMPVFFHAATKSDLAALKLFIAHQVDLNQTNSMGRPVTVQAFDQNKYDQVEFLLNAGVDVSLADSQGVTIGYAVQYKLDQQKADTTTPAFQKLLVLKGLLENRGVKFPVAKPQ